MSRTACLTPGAKLPTHRRLAEVLGVGVGAVTKAYAMAEYQGLVTAHVGRGSFVAEPSTPSADLASNQGPIDLAHNLPPAAPARARLAEALVACASRGDLSSFSGLSRDRRRRGAAPGRRRTG